MRGKPFTRCGRAWSLLRVCLVVVAAVVLVIGALWWATRLSLQPPLAATLDPLSRRAEHLQVLDRAGNALNSTYANRWNVFEQVPLHGVPTTLIDALLLAEDQRFYRHHGQDWRARGRALIQNLVAGRVVRGASTITEQVVRLLNPRPRTVWSRWLEGWEARLLEQQRSKEDILEFYLNQVPYAAHRRGVVQAARYYFDRDLATLSVREMLALAVLVRAPSRLDLYRGDRGDLLAAIDRLSRRMIEAGVLAPSALPAQEPIGFDLRQPTLPVNAGHFLRYVLTTQPTTGPIVRTTLDGSLQRQLQGLLDRRLQQLAHLQLHNAALLVADHQRGEILAWVVGGAGNKAVPGHAINAVLAQRQPGSALKPFLYALALEKGWTAATLIDDSPYAASLGGGLHVYHNYSRSFHGPVTLRVALGNSLNIPALKSLHFIGVANYHTQLRRLGFDSLVHEPDYYGEGLALGNGEVSLLELIQGYSALANRGRWRRLSTVVDAAPIQPMQQVYSSAVASLMGNILSDPAARRLEFGADTLLNFPLQTAVKTGTSSDYRDSWAIGYDARFVVGVWMGNLDQTATYGVTGAAGPALVLRSTFDRLRQIHRLPSQQRALWLSPRLRTFPVCDLHQEGVQTTADCQQRIEYFLPGSSPDGDALLEAKLEAKLEAQNASPSGLSQNDLTWGLAIGSSREEMESGIRLLRPAPGLKLALDPRLDAADQAFEFVLAGLRRDDVVQWRIDGIDIARQSEARYLWSLIEGPHTVSATIWRDGALITRISERSFVVY